MYGWLRIAFLIDFGSLNRFLQFRFTKITDSEASSFANFWCSIASPFSKHVCSMVFNYFDRTTHWWLIIDSTQDSSQVVETTLEQSYLSHMSHIPQNNSRWKTLKIYLQRVLFSPLRLNSSNFCKNRTHL